MDGRVDFKALTQKAEAGDVQAQYLLGFSYYHTKQAEQSYEQAVRWWTLAAEAGDGRAQHALGHCYYHGYGTSQNIDKAIYYTGLSAAQGNAMGHLRLAICYEYGKNSMEMALMHYQQAAEMDNTDALLKMGELHSKGRYVMQDYAKARHLLERAAAQGSREARLLLKEIEGR